MSQCDLAFEEITDKLEWTIGTELASDLQYFADRRKCMWVHALVF